MDDLQLAKPELAAIIGQRLRDVRRARGLSQQALADGLFSKGYVSSIEHGKIFPSVRALQARTTASSSTPAASASTVRQPRSASSSRQS